jgi:integrase
VIDEARSAWLIDAAAGTRLHLPILFAITTGLRRGEILALRWTDVDLENGYLTVNRAIEETKTGVTFKEPKSRRGRRRVSLPPILTDHLETHRAEQDKRRKALGSAYHGCGLICCVEDGSLWKPGAFTSAYRALLKRRKIENIPFHSLRHSHASQLLRAGISPKVISERLGHSKVGFTLDVYSHLLPGMQEEAAQKVDAALKQAFEKQRRVVS